MKQRLDLRATALLVSDYQRLLTSNWTGTAHAKAVVKLLRDHLAESGLPIAFHWERPPRPRQRPAVPPYPIPTQASEELREFLDRANARALEPLQEVEVAEVPDPLEQLAIQCWVLTTWQSNWDLAGAERFFRDVQSLLFMATLHEVLPPLRARHHPYHGLLVEALRWNATNAWHDEPAHALHLQGRLHEYLGRVDAALDHLALAFRLADPSEHDYLTRAHAYWALLTEVGASDEARRFVLELYREAPRESLAEVRELVELSFSGTELQVRED